ncbi:MAG TPA: hypothetical protein VND01_00065, partial [Candidatus Acidoferrales bacterium]|nr:hypothetical protein [Candidatus Acidoferrales bacterium]
GASGTVTVPSITAGSQPLSVTDGTNSPSTTFTVTVTVTPIITISPTSAPDVTIYHPPSLGNDRSYPYADGLTINSRDVGGIGFNGKSFDIAKYGSAIPQQALHIGQSANFTFKIYDERGPDTISHVGMYIHFNGDAIVTHSDTSIVWDKHGGIKVTDPEKFFSDIAVSKHYDNNFVYMSIKFTPTKTMSDSSILMRMWDDKLASIDLPIRGAIIILDPNAPVQVKKVSTDHYSDYHTLVSLLDSDGYQMPTILNKIKSGAELSPSVDISWIYDKGTDKLVMVETFHNGKIIGDTVFNLYKKPAQPALTDHDYVFIPVQNNRQNPEQEQAVMHQEEVKAEKILESMNVGTRQTS